MLDQTLEWYQRRLEHRGRWFRECNPRDVLQARQAHEDANVLVDEARAALGHVQGLKDNVYNSSSTRSGIWNKIRTHHALEIRSGQLENANAEFDGALYDLDMKILNLKLYPA